MGAYTGDDEVDFWTEGEWLENLKRHHVVVMTPQILLDILRHGFVKLGARVTAAADEQPTIMPEDLSSFPPPEAPSGDGGVATTPVVALLIFDECHHAMKGAPMNRIMRLFYDPLNQQQSPCRDALSTEMSSCPHILGLTACPVNSKTGDPIKTLELLECNLHSKVVTSLNQWDEMLTWVAQQR